MTDNSRVENNWDSHYSDVIVNTYTFAPNLEALEKGNPNDELTAVVTSYGKDKSVVSGDTYSAGKYLSEIEHSLLTGDLSQVITIQVHDGNKEQVLARKNEEKRKEEIDSKEQE